MRVRGVALHAYSYAEVLRSGGYALMPAPLDTAKLTGVSLADRLVLLGKGTVGLKTPGY